MMKILLYALLVWFLYNLIFRFIIPVYKTTRKMKQQFSAMHEQMQEKMNQQTGQKPSPVKNPQPVTRKNPDDYIDFEEIK